MFVLFCFIHFIACILFYSLYCLYFVLFIVLYDWTVEDEWHEWKITLHNADEDIVRC